MRIKPDPLLLGASLVDVFAGVRRTWVCMLIRGEVHTTTLDLTNPSYMGRVGASMVFSGSLRDGFKFNDVRPITGQVRFRMSYMSGRVGMN